jgi:chemotaxis protein methyltransferase CheR
MIAAFERLRHLLRRKSGISLDLDKEYLAETRLRPLMQATGARDLVELMDRLDAPGSGDITRRVVEAMTTNETFFFRDRIPFDNFKKLMLPQLLKSRATQRRIRIWCAAASTGQEPYSLAMILDEEVRHLSGWRVEIIATDLSQAVVEAARAGRYSQFEVQRGLPVALLLRYFQREGDSWRINEHLRSRVHFDTLNLMSDFSALGTFDVIFCRNVLIYMDIATKKDVLDRMARNVAPDGYFVMGSAETVVGLTEKMVPHPEHRSFNVPAPEPYSRPMHLVRAAV